MMSKKCKYALKALVRLGGEFGGGHLLTDDIARAENIPKKFLEQILLDLKHATRTLLLNPKVIASNAFGSYFRVNSLFFDPNIYGRFLALVMLGLAGVLLWERRPREVRLAVWQRDGGRCIECGSDFDLQYDHVIPFSMGGATTAENLQLLCAGCNRAKGAAL